MEVVRGDAEFCLQLEDTARFLELLNRSMRAGSVEGQLVRRDGDGSLVEVEHERSSMRGRA